MNHVKRGLICVVFIMTALAATLFGQQPLDPSLANDRMIAIVPMIGAGTYEDPRRPAYVPDYLLGGGEAKKSADLTVDASASPIDAALAEGEAPKAIISFSYELSDDGQFAIVTFEATDNSAFEPLIKAVQTPGASTDAGPNRNALDGGYDLKVFQVGQADPAEIQTEVQKHKKDFTLGPVAVVGVNAQ